MEEVLQHKSKVICFYELLSQEEKVEIPIIQRDYAQGRQDKVEIRTNFLNALYEAVYNKTKLKLDFIYGSKVENDFQPLDGQQRLTTLFLLYWYAAVKEGVSEDEIKILGKFSYETRITSREFCSSMIANRIDISESDSISSKIQDSKWFFLSWKNDPTIDAMLRTIDDIHSKFFCINDLWNELVNNKLITFYYVQLDDIGLTDDLYIKMNARGKLLSPFENFKASLEKRINDKKWEDGKRQSDTFAFKIDTDWTDFFWTKYKRDNSIDEALMRFISTVLMIRFSLEKGTFRTLIQGIHDNHNVIKPETFSEESFNYLYKCFETYSTLEDSVDLTLIIPFWRHNPENGILSEIVFEDKNLSYTQKVLFFAQTEYLINNAEFDQEKFNEWMRVIRNIVSRGNVTKGGSRPDIIRSPETFEGMINLVAEISKGCGDIYSYLSGVEKLSSAFATQQIEEEKLKAKLIQRDPGYKEAIFKMEDNVLFKGRIEFAFECIGIRSEADYFHLDEFNKIQEIVEEHFSDDIGDDISNNIRRALLTIEDNGNYQFYDYWWSYWIVGGATKRCLIDNFRELEFFMYYSSSRVYLEKLFVELISKDLSLILEDFVPPVDMPNWKKRLIKEPNLLDVESKSNYIAIPSDDSCCYLLVSQRPRDISGCYTVE